MSKSAPVSIFAIATGSSLVRAIYLENGQAYSAAVTATRGDPGYGLAAVSKNIAKAVGRKITPTKVILTGSQADLDRLGGKVEAELVSEEAAISAAERYFTKKFGTPTAVLDLGPSAFLDRYPAEEVARWLPFATNLTDVENHLANKRLFPRVLPVTPHEYEIDLAVARQAIIKLGQAGGQPFLQIATKMNLVLTGGLVAAIENLPDLAAVVLDAFYFKSGVRVFVDRGSSLVPLGAILAAADGPEFPEPQLQEIGSMLHLGGIREVTIDFGFKSKQGLSLSSGEIVVLPVEPGHEVTVTLAGKGGHEVKSPGGEGGVYLDNRSRPLGVVAGSKESIGKILSWRKMLSGEKLVAEVGSNR